MLHVPIPYICYVLPGQTCVDATVSVSASLNLVYVLYQWSFLCTVKVLCLYVCTHFSETSNSRESQIRHWLLLHS